MPEQEEVWVPVTVHLPLGFAKAWNPNRCAPISFVCGPYAIILLAQLGNTVLVPVLPFLVKEAGMGARAYGILQSSMWLSQTILSPLLGVLSDYIGRKSVILVGLLISGGGCALLGLSTGFNMMLLARIITGSGFQIALFRAYFADTQPKEKRTGSFGLIGVIQGFSLFMGPGIGGLVSAYGGKRMSALLAAALFCASGFICMCWRPDEDTVEAVLRRRASRAGLSGEALDKHDQSRKTVGGVKFIKVTVDGAGGEEGDGGSTPLWAKCGAVGKSWHKAYILFAYLAKQGVFPLLFLNFFYRFAFAAYKSNFAFLCDEALDFGPKEVGFVLSGMGLGGIFVQGVLVRFVVSRIQEERTLVVAMASTSLGFAGLSYVTSVYTLVPCLAFVSIGYGLAIPCLSALFSHVAVEQGIMQGIAGSIDRFGQSFGPILGGWLLDLVGQAWLMLSTGATLAVISSVVLLFVGDGCVQWARESCMGAEGYKQVGQTDADPDELEMGEGTPNKSATAEEEAAPLNFKNGHAIAAR